VKTESHRKNPQKDRPQRLKPVRDYVEFTGFAFQMAILLLIGYWGGKKLDAWLDLSFPVFTILLILIFLALSFYSLIRKLPKD
jgi:membrane protein DedA with SNARE-associated domain